MQLEILREGAGGATSKCEVYITSDTNGALQRGAVSGLALGLATVLALLPHL